MGYRIEYTGGPGNISSAKERKPSRWMMVGIFLLLFVLLVNCFSPRGREILDLILWPGDKAQLMTALETMAQELGAGKPVSGAIEDFCREILDGEALALS